MFSSVTFFDFGTMWPFYLLIAIWGTQLQLLLTALAYDGYKAIRERRLSPAVSRAKDLWSQFDQSQGAALFSRPPELQ